MYRLIMRAELLMCFVLRITLGPRVKIYRLQKYFKPPLVHATDRSTAMGLVLFFFMALWFLPRGV